MLLKANGGFNVISAHFRCASRSICIVWNFTAGMATSLDMPSVANVSIDSFLHQRSSWGSLQISKETFLKIFSYHEASPILLDAILSFGTKVTGEDDSNFNICYNRILSDCNSTQDKDKAHGEYWCDTYLGRKPETHQKFVIFSDILSDTGEWISSSHGPSGRWWYIKNNFFAREKRFGFSSSLFTTFNACCGGIPLSCDIQWVYTQCCWRWLCLIGDGI